MLKCYHYRTILLSVISIFYSIPLYCMKHNLTTQGLKKRSKRIKIQPYENIHPFLPHELQTQILIHHIPDTTKRSSIKAVGKYINTLSLVNKELNTYINNPSTIRSIINAIYDATDSRYAISRYCIAQTISTKSAINYVVQNAILLNKVKKIYSIPLSIKTLIQQGADINYESILSSSVKSGSYMFTLELLTNGADPNTQDYEITPLEYAIKDRNKDLIKLLLKHNPQKKCLIAAIEIGDNDCLKYLLKTAKVTDDEILEACKYTSSHYLCEEAKEILINYCLDKNILLNQIISIKKHFTISI